MTDPTELLQRGVALHKSGDLRAAGECYGAVLKAAPDHVGALYPMGMLAFQMGHSGPAVDILNRTVALVPSHAEAHNVLGLALSSLNRNEEAEASFQRSLALLPTPATHNNLGILLKKSGRLNEALVEFKQAVDHEPNYQDAKYNCGNTYRALGQLEQAKLCFEGVIANSPDHGHAQAALGQVLIALKDFLPAATVLRQALLLLGPDAELHCDLGDALLELKDTTAALAEYGKALEQSPKLARSWFSIGCVHNATKDSATAAECFRKALDTEPGWAEAHHNLGQSLFELGQVDDALLEFDLASAGPRPAMPKMMKSVIIPGSPQASNESILAVRRAWALEALNSSTVGEQRKLASPQHQRLRIGYVSAFFGRDNWMKPVWCLINHHDRQQFDIYLFSDGPASAIQHGYQPHPTDLFYDISKLDNERAVRLIKAAEIDILVDLNGYSRVARLPLLASHPARVVVGWFNMFATTGIAAYDYLIGDAEVIPPDEEPFYTERILRVAGSYLTFQVQYPVPGVESTPTLKGSSFTFGCLAPQYKVIPEVIAVWTMILNGFQNSRLLLKNTTLRSAAGIRFVTSLFAEHGVPAERLILEGPAEHYEFLKTYGRVDLALDTFPYNGGTTTTEAIWQGVPVVAFYGDRWVSRTSSSILRNAGLGEFVGESREGYVKLAMKWAAQRDELSAMRHTMRSRLERSAVCDAPRFARSMERLYSQVSRSAES